MYKYRQIDVNKFDEIVTSETDREINYKILNVSMYKNETNLPCDLSEFCLDSFGTSLSENQLELFTCVSYTYNMFMFLLIPVI